MSSAVERKIQVIVGQGEVATTVDKWTNEITTTGYKRKKKKAVASQKLTQKKSTMTESTSVDTSASEAKTARYAKKGR